MAVAVSEAWKSNQKSAIQSRGFVVVELGNDSARYTSGCTITRIGGSQTDDYFFISDKIKGEMTTAAEINIVFQDPDTTAYRTLYMELETASTASNVNYECRDYPTGGGKLVHYSDNRTIISFPIPAGCITYNITFTKWFDASEKIKVKSLSFGKNITIPTTRIKSCTHLRSYDPMGLELPQNNMQVDIFNFDDAYTSFYEEYANERIKITLKYGYVFQNTTEVIQGGEFYTKSVQNDDGILTIQGDNTLSLVDDDENIEFADLAGDIYSDTTGAKFALTYEDFTNDMPFLYFEALLDNIRTIWNVNIVSNSLFNGMRAIYNSISGRRIEIFQGMINASLQRCRIDRYNRVTIESISGTQSSSNILLLNSLEKPALSMSKKVKCIVLNAFDFESCIRHTYYYKPYKADVFYLYDIDTTKECMYSVNAPVGIKKITKSVAQTEDGHTMSYSGTLIDTTSKDVTLITVDLSTGNITKTISVNDTGDTCDMTNDVAAPIAPSKISAYFSNRRIYGMNIRGDPARDAGDYVMVSQKNDSDSSTFEKGLVLSSELTFDGSFKEKLSVRIIETEFEAEEESET